MDMISQFGTPAPRSADKAHRVYVIRGETGETSAPSASMLLAHSAPTGTGQTTVAR